jgi:uncharacterized protein (TIGR02453 family)
MAETFTGFTPQTIEFYRGLAEHNGQAWFEAHRADYLAHAMAPAQALVLELGPRLQELRPGFQFSPDYNGKGSIKKIHTDRRFNAEREPYKTWLGIFFWEGSLTTKKDNSVVSLRLSGDELMLAAGFKHFAPPVLKAYRAAVADEAAGRELVLLTAKLAKPGYEIGGAGGFAQVPRGFPADHPRAALLKHNAICVMHREPISDVLFSPKLAAHLLKHFQEMLPLHAWCVETASRLN